MSVDPAEVVSIGTTGVAVTRLGFGAASIGGLFAEVEDEDARATIEHAYDMGIRSFDVAPLYGYGAAERRLGAVLQMKPRDSYVVSTKVGRLVRRAADVVPGSDIDSDTAPVQLTSDEQVLMDAANGWITIGTTPLKEFECPVIPVQRNR